MPSLNSYEQRILRLEDDASKSVAVERAALIVRAGGLIVYPTETVYGVGADARNPDALRRIPLVKGRDEQKPILVLVESSAAVDQFARAVPATAITLMEAFWPGPLTLVFRAREDVSGLLTAGTRTIGLRCSPHPFCRALIERTGAITSTSANRSGQPTPGVIQEIARQLRDRIDLYVDAGAQGGRAPSTVVDVTGPHPRLIREGAIALSDIRPYLRR